MNQPFVEMKNINKYFSRVIANKMVNITINKGEVLAILGENGAGKSTKMKILYGLYKAEEGEIFIDGEVCNIKSPKDAIHNGIGMIQQHFSLIPAHTVLENIILGNEKGIFDKKMLHKKIDNLSRKYSFNIDSNSYIKDLPVGIQQKIEILKALYQEVKLLIMDEPTAVLTPQESLNLIDFIKQFAKKGNSVVFISHKLNEVLQVADRIVVMREGVVLCDILKKDTNKEELSKLMVGKEIKSIKIEKIKKEKKRKTKLRIENLIVQGKQGHTVLKQISFSVDECEIFGIAGVSGNGQQELGEAICGVSTIKSGQIYLNEKSISNFSVQQRIEEGVGYVHADRHSVGLILDMSLSENMLLKNSFHPEWSKMNFINKKKLNKYAEDTVSNYSVKASGVGQIMRGLSGGNQQKIVIAREVEIGKELIVFDQPTRGLDLGAIEYVHKTILKERENGKSILLISTELSEIFALSDRIGVIYNGKLLKILKTEEATIHEVGMLMAGYKQDSDENNE